jgi:hypothetical protein
LILPFPLHGVAPDGVTLSVNPGPNPLELTLAWTGGQPPFQVYRSTDAAAVAQEEKLLGETEDRTWTDQPPEGDLFFFLVTSPCVFTPPEVCDGMDNDCDGTIDGPGSEGSCALAHASAACLDGRCAIGDCDSGFGDCDLDAATGCEADLAADAAHCGACGNACSFPNASAQCASGSCVMGGCARSFADCDGIEANGCEVQNSGYSNVPPGENLGSFDADSCAGGYCTCLGCPFLLSRSGTRGRYFQITAREASACSAYVALRFELIVPPGADYDLYVSGGCRCAPTGCSSTASGNDSVVVYCDDTGAGNDGFTAQVEVRYYSGRACEPWTLNVYRREC